MKKKNKIFLIFFSISMLIGLPLFFLPHNPDIYIIPQFYIDELIQFILNNLRDSNSSVFLKYQLADKTYDEMGSRIYTSFNIWAYFSFVEVSRFKNDPTYKQNYAIPAINFIMQNLLNHTTFGVHHWCFKNGSYPTPNVSLYNDSQNIFTTYQAWLSLALLDLYQSTNNETYLDYANKTLNFLIEKLWDPVNYGFYYAFFPYNESNWLDKDSWYQAWALESLIKGYEITNNQSYLFYINKTIDFMINFLWDNVYGGFYYYTDANGSNQHTDKFLANQAGSITAFLAAATTFNNQSLISNYIMPTLNFTRNFLWNEYVGQFYSQTNSTGGDPNDLIICSESSVMMKAVIEYTERTNDSTYFHLVQRSLNHLITKMWDAINFGFFKMFDFNSLSVIDYDKWTQDQVFPLIIFCKLLYNDLDTQNTIKISSLGYYFNRIMYSNNLNNFLLFIAIFGSIYGVVLLITTLFYFNKFELIKKFKKEKKLTEKKKKKYKRKSNFIRKSIKGT